MTITWGRIDEARAMPERKTIVLFSPHFVAVEARDGRLYRGVPPLSHLALAGPLRAAGYEVVILDAKWDTDWRDTVSGLAERLLCVGVTALTGPAVSDGLEFSAFVKALRPGVPVVWGGWHATFAAAQAVQDPRIDIVVRGMGERAFVELVGALESGAPLATIQGIHFRDQGRVVATEDRLPEEIEAFPPPAYDLIRPERYLVETADGHRLASTIFSRGCPYACDFCLDSRKRWFGLSIDRMIADIEFWVSRGADRMQFYDGNFFLARSRLIEFCDALVARGLPTRMRWIATAVGRRVAGMDDELLTRLKQAGLMQVAIGAESGSDELLARITNKTTVETTIEAVRRLTRHGIDQYLFFMVGYPDEPADALGKTLDFIRELKRINPRVTLCLNFATPLPGSEVFLTAVRRGLLEAPASFEDWARFDYRRPNLLGVDADYVMRVKRFQQFLNLAYPLPGARWSLPTPVRKLARWRLDHGYFRYTVELSMVNGIERALAAVGA